MPTTVAVAAEEAFQEEATKQASVRAQPPPRPVRIPLPLLETKSLPAGLTFLHAPSALAHEALYAAAARAAMDGVVIWRDAATMFDPRRIARCAARLRVSATPLLENVRIARSFTVHQFVAQMESLRDSIEEWEPALVIVTGFYTHFEDPDVDRWDARRLLRRTMLALGSMAALPRRDSVGRNEEDDDDGGFASPHETPLRHTPHTRPSAARPGVVAGARCPVVLCDASVPRGLHRIVAPSLALEAHYDTLKKGVIAEVGDERIICRPRPPGQTALDEFIMTFEGGRGEEAAHGGGLSSASPLVPPPSITEWM
jgi:hypothetical protein